MKKEDIIRKLTSRKFIVALITIIVGIITLLCGYNENVQTIAGAAMVVVPALAYCIMEGKVDAASVKQITEATQEAAQKLGASEQTAKEIGTIGDAMCDLVGDEERKE